MDQAARVALARRHPDSLLYWTLAHRYFQGRPITLPPLMQALYEDGSDFIVVQKAAQAGVSEFLLNTALWVSDTGRGGRGNALYVMPTMQMAHDFAQARFEKAIFTSPYLTARAQPRRGAPARADLRKVGPGYVYLRGSDSERQIISVDADVVVVDEVDSVADGVVEKVLHRLDSSPLRWHAWSARRRHPGSGSTSGSSGAMNGTGSCPAMRAAIAKR